MRYLFFVIGVSLMMLTSCASEQILQGDVVAAQQTPFDTQPQKAPEQPVAVKDVPLKEVIREEPTVTEPEKVEKTASLFSDGTHTQTQQYTSPGGKENFELSIDVEDDVIRSVTLTSLESTTTGVNFQTKVGKELPALMVGKKIDEITLPSKISGSSLTLPAVQNALQEMLS